MNKRHLHHVLTTLKNFRLAYFVILIVISAFVSLMAYRNNNLTAIELRNELLEVDRQNGDVEAALRKLRSHTHSHMNASLKGGPNNIYPPIQLKYRYERLVAAEKARVQAANAQLYTEAQEHCERQVTSRVTINRVPCIQEYLAARGGAKEQPIPDALYKFDFVSPAWSPDLAGWSLVVTVGLILALIGRVLTEWWLRYSLSR